MAHAIEKYLARHAEPEACLACQIPDAYAHVLAVPVRDEDPRFLSSVRRAAENAAGPVLAILVVNATATCAPDVHARNASFVRRLRNESAAMELGASGAWFGRLGGLSVLLVDRGSPPRLFSHRDGVGLARKIGADVGLALHRAGRTGPWLLQTDADAQLPADYFARFDARADPGRAAATLPFWHELDADPRLSRAISLYEASLRYFVAGLAWAGSPYAFHTIGSAMAVTASGYAAVRGHPRRLAGEDFYLLNKVAKVGVVHRLDGEPIRLRARRSTRTPFGTGRALEAMLRTVTEPTFYDPRCFDVLKILLRQLEAFSSDGRVEELRRALRTLEGPAGDVVYGEFERADAWRALGRLVRVNAPGGALRRAVHGWFDAFRTLKLIHALRDFVYPNLVWAAALRAARFMSGDVVSALGDGDALRAALSDQETTDERWQLVGPGPPD